MPRFQLGKLPPASTIESRACPNCKAPMVLVRIKPAGLGFDRCTFECIKCENTENVTLKTVSALWRSSPLRAPD